MRPLVASIALFPLRCDLRGGASTDRGAGGRMCRLRAIASVFLLAALALSGAGCSSTDLTAFANDKNADCVTETSVYVNLKFDRNWGCEYPPPGFMLVPVEPPAPTK